MKRIAFVGGMVFNSDSETFVSCNILCDDGFITDLTRSDVPYGYEIVRVDGKYIIPGLVDVHTHGISGYDFNYASEEDMSKMLADYARQGTTSVMATLASQTMSKLMNSIFSINQMRLRAKTGCASILGVHLEGRYLNPDMRGCHSSDLLAKPNVDELCSLAFAMMPPPLHFSIAPELDGADAFIRKAREFGATVGIAHTNSTYEQAEHALLMGATSFTHTFNAMTKIHHRSPGCAVCALDSDDAYAEIICDGEHVHPAMVKLAYKSKPSDRLVLVTDSMAATASPDGEYEIAGTKVYVSGGRATDVSGTLAGSTLTMFRALTNMMDFCDISLNEAIKYATVNPAAMIDADAVGKIARCYRADFITLDDINNPEIDTVYVGGEKVF